MAPDTTVSGKISAPSGRKRTAILLRLPSWPTIPTWLIVSGLLVAALLMRLYTLHAPFDRDSYDEGVYWQSLRAMSAGHALYRDIFYSQPPFFLLSIYPFYAL